MIQTALNGMITVMLAKFTLNDVPHAIGLSGDVRWEITSKPDPDTPGARIVTIKAMVNGKQIGVVGGKAYPPTKSGSVVGIVVVEEFRKRGVATGLLDRYMAELTKMGIRTVSAYNLSEQGLELVLHYGFKESYPDSDVYVYEINNPGHEARWVPPEEKYRLVKRTKRGSLIVVYREGDRAELEIPNMEDMEDISNLLSASGIKWESRSGISKNAWEGTPAYLRTPRGISKGYPGRTVMFDYSDLERVIQGGILQPMMLES